MEKHSRWGWEKPCAETYVQENKNHNTTLGLLKHQVADGVPDNIKLNRQKAKAAYDQHERPLPELQTGEPVRLQPINPKVPWEKGTCIAKIGPQSYLVESETGQL